MEKLMEAKFMITTETIELTLPTAKAGGFSLH